MYARTQWGTEELRWDVSLARLLASLSACRFAPLALAGSIFQLIVLLAKIFSANWTETQWSYPPVAGEKGYVGSATYWEFSGEVAIYDASVYPNASIAFPLTDLPRSTVDVEDEQYWWLGGFANGSQIQPGYYV